MPKYSFQWIAFYIILATVTCFTIPASAQLPVYGAVLSDTIVTLELKIDAGDTIELSLREGEMGQVSFGGDESYGFIGTLPEESVGQVDLFVARLTNHESGDGAVVEQLWKDDIALGGSRHFDFGPGFELTVAPELGQATSSPDT
ncbi:MAG: hypothetical protein AAGD01_14935 [Acidobacteriota bacterium]